MIDYTTRSCQRTQRPDESTGLYIAAMVNMFNRLTCPVSEGVKLKILLRNISPFYQSQLGLVSVTSVEHLTELGKQLEERKKAIKSFHPPPRDKKVMKLDLAYVYTGSRPFAPTATVSFPEKRPRLLVTSIAGIVGLPAIKPLS